ncbi:nucleotide disphospho-sugar-binding domain-containing protein [Microbacterium sp. AZCO]|uniref:glycosyltransferase n=1 Tax=Microbacterium sp. AZCO TaxID=3142976 RepID=UPI0031F35748
MARFLITAMPFTGHVLQLSAVAEALVERGHEVRFYTGSAFARQVESAGARFIPWREAPDFDETDVAATFPRLRGSRGLGQIVRTLEELFLGTSPGQLRDLQAEWYREPWDVLVGDEASLGPAFAAERTRCAWATVCALPLGLPSDEGPPHGLGLRPGQDAWSRSRDEWMRRLSPIAMRPVAGRLARVRSDAGLGPSPARFDEAAFSRQLILATGVPALDHERTDRPSHLHFVGRLAPSTPIGRTLPEWWTDLEGRRVVHVTQGTQNVDPRDLLQPALAALADDDVLVVATSGLADGEEPPLPLPRNARVSSFVPHDALLPHAEAVITNGGWGGVLAALSHGIPLLVAGGDLDKPEVAARVAQAGAGIDLRGARPSPRTVGRAYRALTTDASYRATAERIAAELAAAGGAARAAELLEDLAARRREPTRTGTAGA